MLLSKTTTVKWNSRNKNRYVNFGYKYTQMGDYFEANIEDLTDSCKGLVEVQCDYCKCVYQITWDEYVHKKRNLINNDCCGNCVHKKIQETMFIKYGVDSTFKLDEVQEKIKQTNLKKYGCVNPFGNKEIQEKIAKTFYEKNGEGKWRSEESLAKRRTTCMEKYGVDCYLKLPEFKESMKGENCPWWKGNKVSYERTERALPEYREWRKSVYIRDNYTCQCCGIHNGLGKHVDLEAHHILDFANHKDKACDVNNGITLCKKCHIKFHSDYGKHGNNQEQLDEFLFKYKTSQRIKKYIELIGGVK